MKDVTNLEKVGDESSARRSLGSTLKEIVAG